MTRTALCVGLGLASACVASTDATAGERDDGALASGAALTPVEGGVVYARLMHTLDLGGDHRVQFFDAGGGTYGVRETMPLENAQRSVMRDDGLVATYLRAAPGARLEDVPLDIRQADEHVAGAEDGPVTGLQDSDFALSASGADGVAAVSQALTTCSTDIPGGDFGAAFFVQNFCFNGQLRQCFTNRAHATTQQAGTSNVGFVQGSSFSSRVMEGDFNVAGRTRGWWAPKGWLATSGKSPTLLWDIVVAPRRIEIQNWTAGSGSQWRSIGDSPCSHAHAGFFAQ